MCECFVVRIDVGENENESPVWKCNGELAMKREYSVKATDTTINSDRVHGPRFRMRYLKQISKKCVDRDNIVPRDTFVKTADLCHRHPVRGGGEGVDSLLQEMVMTI